MDTVVLIGRKKARQLCGVDSYRRELHRWWPRARCQREDVHNNAFGLLRLRLLGGSSIRRDRMDGITAWARRVSELFRKGAMRGRPPLVCAEFVKA